jgi:hypothetical protein
VAITICVPRSACREQTHLVTDRDDVWGKLNAEAGRLTELSTDTVSVWAYPAAGRSESLKDSTLVTIGCTA